MFWGHVYACGPAKKYGYLEHRLSSKHHQLRNSVALLSLGIDIGVLISVCVPLARDRTTRGARPADIRPIPSLSNHKQFCTPSAFTQARSLQCTSFTLHPAITSCGAQLTLKVQLQERALGQSRVKYFYVVALDDRENHLLLCSSKRPQVKLEN